MSAIFGIVRFDGRPVLREDLELMSGPLARRGPQEPGFWLDDHCGFGHRMLHTGESSIAGLHVWDRGGRPLVATAEGRLDNRAELISRLGLVGQPGDSELILRLYDRFGDKVPEMLLGDFTFALYDVQQRRLLCARDHMGVKPFCYLHQKHVLVFASGVEAITALPWLDIRLNRQRIADYLVPSLEAVDHTSTFYRDIFRMPPAHRMTFSTSTQAKLQRYWQLDPSKALHFNSDAECNEAFLSVLKESVAARMQGQSVTGLALSGGIDSGALAAMGRQMAPAHRLRTYSGIADQPAQCAESQRLLGVIRQGGVVATTLSPSQMHSTTEALRTVVEHTSDPFDNKMSLYPAMCSLAAGDGVKVMMDGVDDVVMDSVESCNSYLLREGRWISVLRDNAAIARISEGEASLAGLLYVDIKRLFANRAQIWFHNRRRLTADRKEVLQNFLISPALADDVNMVGRLRQFRETWPQQLCASLRHANAIEVSHPALTVALERYDRIASCFGLEPRHPYMDKRFVEFCLALPWQYKDYGGWPKITLRRSMQGVLPEASRWQADHQHLGWQFTMRRMEHLREEILAVLEAEAPRLVDLINMEKLQASITKMKRQECESRDSAYLWSAFTLAHFLRRNPAL